MDLQLQDKHVLITGGGKGIGLACAQGVLREGARVTLVSRSQENLDAAEAALGNVDALVNRAGEAKRTPAPELTPQDWHNAMSAKYFTYIHMIDPAIKRMGERGVV